jgi:hypothetical protein
MSVSFAPKRSVLKKRTTTERSPNNAQIKVDVNTLKTLVENQCKKAGIPHAAILKEVIGFASSLSSGSLSGNAICESFGDKLVMIRCLRQQERTLTKKLSNNINPNLVLTRIKQGEFQYEKKDYTGFSFFFFLFFFLFPSHFPFSFFSFFFQLFALVSTTLTARNRHLL